MGVCGGGDDEIHGAGTGPASGVDHGGGQVAVADGYGIVQGQGVEFSLQDGAPSQAFGSDGRVAGDEHAEVQFGQGVAALIASSPWSGGTSVAVTMPVSSSALTVRSTGRGGAG